MSYSLRFWIGPADRKVVEPVSVAVRTNTVAPHEHLVEFYDTEAFLVDTVCAFLAPALRDGDAAIVVATTAHRHRFELALRDAGVDLDAAASDGRYLAFNAADVLAGFMVEGQPDAGRFRKTVGAVMGRASGVGRRIRVYGEMVAVLCDAGNMASALALEDLWNELAAERRFALLCAYPMRAFAEEDSTTAFRRICDQHTTVIPSEDYSLLADPAERSRVIAQLQQRAAALDTELQRLRLQQEQEHTSDERDQAGQLRDQAGNQRDHAGKQRDQAGRRRDQAGNERDHVGTQRDNAADERDEAAELRDQAAEHSEAEMHAGIPSDVLNRMVSARQEAASDRRRAFQDRRAGAGERGHAELDRTTALADRGAGAGERSHAELDRTTALADRGASAKEREHASHDDLTGVYLRGAGFVELERDIARARRTNQPLVVAFVDVDHLKAINDSQGHAAGDSMLRHVVNAIRTKLRSYDLVIRYGGDEFVCAISGLSMAAVRTRMALVNAALSEATGNGSVTVGLAELLADDSLAGLVARADAALYRERLQQRR